MNMNGQPPNQFVNYQNYHHEQLMHHQYFDENPHGQNYNFIPYNETYTTIAAAPPANEQPNHQENFSAIQSNELYEFLPEEIFQLDQPIVKSESQSFHSNGNVPVISHMETLQIPFATHNGELSSTSHSFLDLSSGQIQTNMKYPMVVDGFSSEINNNSNYQSSVGVENVHVQSKVLDANAYNYQEASTRLNCAVEGEKVLKRKHLDIDPIVKQNTPTLHQNYHLNQPLFSKRESSCLLQQTSTYYPAELYANFPSKPNDVYRAVEKYNNYITNN